jgi:hypothetical protein
MNQYINKSNWPKIMAVTAIIFAGVAYYFSDPFQAIVDRKVSNWTEWTPETIRNHPTEWLMSAQEDLVKKRANLKASRFDIRRNQLRWEDNLRAAKRDEVTSAKFVDKAKLAYRLAEERQEWPVQFSKREFSKAYGKETLQKEIVAKHREQKRASQRVATYHRMVTRADSLTSKIDTKLDQINEVQLDVALAIELSKAAEQLTDITGLSDRGKEIQVTVKALMEELDGAFEGSTSSSLQNDLGDEIMFEQIMGDDRRENGIAGISVNKSE